MKNTKDFWVECNVCKTQLKNHVGSTPCCGSIAWLIENDKPTMKISIFGSLKGGNIEETFIEFKKK